MVAWGFLPRQAPPSKATDTLTLQIDIVAVVFTVIAALGVVARVASIRLRRVGWKADDYMLLVAFVGFESARKVISREAHSRLRYYP